MRRKDALSREEMIEFVMSCWDEEAGPSPLSEFRLFGGLRRICMIIGAFGAHPGHDAHLLPTLSAIQILVTQDALDRVDVDRVTKCQYLLASSFHRLL